MRIGTSGWHYKHWIGTFYPSPFPARNMLAYYAERLNTVEVNNSFYHLPKEPALISWREGTPPDFCFAAKASRYLTHMKKLKDAADGLARFLDAVDVLGDKLGPILFQLPPNWEMDLERLSAFLDVLPRHHRYAFEFRHPSWEQAAVYELLGQHNAAFCIFDLAGYQSPHQISADFTYVRLHGPGGKYQGSYGDVALKTWAKRIREWSKTLRSVWLYFDNDDSGYAPANALRLKELIESPRETSSS